MDNEMQLILSEIQSDLKEIRKDVASIDKTLAVNTVSLEEHHKRTTTSEARLDILEKQSQRNLNVLKGIGFAFAGLMAAHQMGKMAGIQIFEIIIKALFT